MACAGGDMDTLRIVLLGKTGAGKSSLGNTLLGKAPSSVCPTDDRDRQRQTHQKESKHGFRVGRGLRSQTVFCGWNCAVQSQVKIEVTDTPGLCDTHLSKEVIYKEVAKSVAVASPGPNVIIFVLRCDRRLTQEEYQAYQTIKHLFSEEINKYLILVFNGLDTFGNDSIENQRKCLAEDIRDYGKPLDDMLKEAGGRYFGFNNNAPDEEKALQRRDFIALMQDLVRKNGRKACYRSELSLEIMGRLEKMVRMMDKSEDVGPLRILLVGKSGAGKSSLGNTLLGKKAPGPDSTSWREEKTPEYQPDSSTGFRVGRGLRSETRFCGCKHAVRFGTNVTVVDTPGLCETHVPEREIMREVAKSLSFSQPGPNVIVFTLRCDRRFTEEEFRAFRDIQKLFSEEINKFLIFVLNGIDTFHGGELDTIDDQRKALASEIPRNLIQNANGRFFGMNNKASPAERDRQAQDLINMMKDLVRENGKGVYYTKDKKAASKEEPQYVFTPEIRRKIIEEDVSPGFFESLSQDVRRAATRVRDSITGMCSVM